MVRWRDRFVWEALECSDNKSLYLFFHLSNENEQPVSGRLKEGFKKKKKSTELFINEEDVMR